MTTGIAPRYRIENALPEHLRSLGAIERAAARIFPPGRIPEDRLDDTVPLSMLEEAVGLGALFVALDSGAPGARQTPQPVGYALLRFVDGHALLAQIDVHPAHGRQGLGTALVKKVATAARQNGYDALYLTTFETIAWNAPFYAKLGFTALRAEDEPAFLRAILAEERSAELADRIGMRLLLQY